MVKPNMIKSFFLLYFFCFLGTKYSLGYNNSLKYNVYLFDNNSSSGFNLKSVSDKKKLSV